jgi:hypothetical protein
MHKQKTFKNYRELLAKERSETERMFILKVLERNEAEPPPLSASADGIALAQRRRDRTAPQVGGGKSCGR